MKRVLDSFINRPTQSVAEFDLEFNTTTTTQFPIGRPGGASSLVKATTNQRIGEPPVNTGIIYSCHTNSTESSSQDTSTCPSPGTIVQAQSAVTDPGKLTNENIQENALRTLWSAVLGLPGSSIGHDESFFDLGGDSITAMKLVGDARDQGLMLTVADVFRYPSFGSMAGIARSRHKSVPGRGNGPSQSSTYERFSLLASSNVDTFLQTSIVPHVGVFKGGLQDVLPATDFQSLAVSGALLESRWMLNYFCFDGDGPLSVTRLKLACFRVVQKLDILRTLFVPSGGRFLQVVLRTLRPVFHVIDVDDDGLNDYTERLKLQEGEDGRVRGFGIHQLTQPFVEFTVLRHRHSCRHKILLRVSHAQYDGVCFPKILDALGAAYEGEEIPSPPSFANYLRASAGALTPGHYQYWKNLLEGSFMTEIVRRRGPSYRTTTTGAMTSLKRTVNLPPVEYGHITTATVVKAAWAYVLAQLSGTTDVVFGHTISGRNAAIEGIGNMIGPCINLVPVRVRFDSGGLTVMSLLRQVQEQQVANMPHEVLGFREIVGHCTAWPAWTYFTSTVQHQNVDQNTLIRLGNIEYKVGCASPAHQDFADLSIFSERNHTYGRTDADSTAGDMYDITLSFTTGGAIPPDFAEHTLGMLCDTAHRFSTDTNVPLSSPVSLGCGPPILPFADVPSIATGDEHSNSYLQRLSRTQLLAISSLVTTAWKEVLNLQGPDIKALETEARGATNNETSTNSSSSGASFFSFGGDIIGLAQVGWLLSQGGFPMPRLEALIDNPTVQGHMAVLAYSQFSTVSGTRGEVIASTHPSTQVSKKIRTAHSPVDQIAAKADSPVSKVIHLVKKFTKQSNKTQCEVSAPGTSYVKAVANVGQ